jgi:acetyl-CoA synthetase
VFLANGRIPELYVTALGTLKYTCFFVLYFLYLALNLFQRVVSKGDVTILITLNLYERKVKQLVERLPSLRYIILTDAAEHLSDKILSFSTLMEQASTDFKIPETNPEDAFTPFYQWNYGMPKAFYMCIMLFLPIT